MSVWSKRISLMSERGIAQNMSLGVGYFRYDALEAETADVEALRLGDALAVLEEVASRGRCVIALPGERRVAVYAVDGAEGAAGLTWYERLELLEAVGVPAPRSRRATRATRG